MKQIKKPLIIATLSVIIFYAEISSIFSIGRLINDYFTCKQEPLDSFPCWGIYDVFFILLLIGIIISSLIIIGIRLYKIKKEKN